MEVEMKCDKQKSHFIKNYILSLLPNTQLTLWI